MKSPILPSLWDAFIKKAKTISLSFNINRSPLFLIIPFLYQMKYSVILFFFFILSVIARPSKVTLTSLLSKRGVDTSKIGCKCIMTEATKKNEDETMCLCYNRKDGTANDSSKCTAYTGNIYIYIYIIQNTSKLILIHF